MSIQNSHVLKWYRWRVWCLGQSGRLMAQTFWIELYNEELRKA